MSHSDHSHSSDDSDGVSHHVHEVASKKKSRSKTIGIMIGLVTLFMVAELVVGVISSSLTLLGDSFHMMSDLLSMFIGLFSIRLAKKGASDTMSFGYQRAEALGGLFNATFLLSMAFFLLVEITNRVLDPPDITDLGLVLITAVLGLVVNIIGAFMFHDHGHGHSGHDHDHGHGDVEEGHSHEDHSGTDFAMRGMFLHILGDLLGSVAAIVSGAVLYFTDDETFPLRRFVDPLCSLIIVLIIIRSSLPLVRDTSHILMQGVPRTVSLPSLEQNITAVQGVVGVHELHIWQFVSRKLIAHCHIVVAQAGPDGTEARLAATQYRKILQDVKTCFHTAGIHNSTVQMEPLPVGQDDPSLCFASFGCSAEDSWCCERRVPK